MGANRYLYFPVFVLLLGFFAVLTAKSEQQQERVIAALRSVQAELRGGGGVEVASLAVGPEQAVLLAVADRLRQYLPAGAIVPPVLTNRLELRVPSEAVFVRETALVTRPAQALLSGAAAAAGLQEDGLAVTLLVSSPSPNRPEAPGRDATEGTGRRRLVQERLLALGRVAWFGPARRQYIRIGYDEGAADAVRLIFTAEPVDTGPFGAASVSGDAGAWP